MGGGLVHEEVFILAVFVDEEVFVGGEGVSSCGGY